MAGLFDHILADLPPGPSEAKFPSEAFLDAHAMVESGGDPNARSPKDALGLHQILLSTARDPGFGVEPLQTEEDLRDPVKNRRLAPALSLD